ncbi:MAG: hypothetical protein LH473_08695, partial [Chitinophagales bacterium]|nr:hypothetical protein [Chitinophagales bacterium]
MNLRNIVLLSTLTLTMFSCVSTKKFKSEVAKYDSLNQRYQQLADDLRACEDQKLQNAKKLEELQTQNDYLKKNNTAVLNNLQDLSVVTSAQAESIRKSLENLGLKDAYIYDLQK